MKVLSPGKADGHRVDFARGEQRLQRLLFPECHADDPSVGLLVDPINRCEERAVIAFTDEAKRIVAPGQRSVRHDVAAYLTLGPALDGGTHALQEGARSLRQTRPTLFPLCAGLPVRAQAGRSI